jgi:hypothetical protein
LSFLPPVNKGSALLARLGIGLTNGGTVKVEQTAASGMWSFGGKLLGKSGTFKMNGKTVEFLTGEILPFGPSVLAKLQRLILELEVSVLVEDAIIVWDTTRWTPTAVFASPPEAPIVAASFLHHDANRLRVVRGDSSILTLDLAHGTHSEQARLPEPEHPRIGMSDTPQ